MKTRIRYSLLLILLNSTISFTQTTSIKYESNGRDTIDISTNPFWKFVGEWTLKNDDWSQNWGFGTETIKIPNHHTVTKNLNTNHSLISIIDGPPPNGHIFWTYNPNTKQVHHLSSFGTIRTGTGTGSINENGDVRLKLVFEGEAPDTYRIYNYKWLNADEYHMKSVQFNKDDEPTGLFYEGNFIRIDTKGRQNIRDEISDILNVLDNNDISVAEQLHVYADNVTHMAPNNEIIKDKIALSDYLVEQRKYGVSKMKHQIDQIEEIGDQVIVQGTVSGTFYPNNESTSIDFKTKNLFVFKRIKGVLKISKVIYNMSPSD